MIGCLRTHVRKQLIIAHYFEFETVVKFYNLKASFAHVVIVFCLFFVFCWFLLIYLLIFSIQHILQKRRDPLASPVGLVLVLLRKPSIAGHRQSANGVSLAGLWGPTLDTGWVALVGR